MRKIMALFIAIMLAFSSTLPAFAKVARNEDISNVYGMTKSEFADYCDSLASAQSRSMSTLSAEEISDLLGAYSVSSGTERKEIESSLNAAGCYIYSCTSDDQITPRSQPSDVTMGTVAIAYITYTQEWVVGFGGYWSSALPIGYEVFSDFISVSVGEQIPVGGFDAAGIVFYNTSGTVPNMVSSVFKVTDYSAGNSGNEITSYTPSTYDSASGIGFLYQDKVIIKGLNGVSGSPTYSYLGLTFTVSTTYDQSFEHYNGFAKGFYYHTWDTTSITGIGFTIGLSELGVNIAWVNAGNSFPAYSAIAAQF